MYKNRANSILTSLKRYSKVKKEIEYKSTLPEEAHRILNKGRFQTALKMYQLCLEKQPDDFMLNAGIGLTYTEMGQHAKALEFYDKALTCRVIESRMPKFWFHKGRTHMEIGEYEKALKCFESAYDLDPHNFLALLNQGAMWAELGHTEKALDAYNKLLMNSQFIPSPLDSPIMTGVFYNRGQMLDKLEHYGEALKNYDEALSLLRARKWKFADFGMNKDHYIKEIYGRKLAILQKLERSDEIRQLEKKLEQDLALKPKQKGDFTKENFKKKVATKIKKSNKLHEE
jgi:tetratricopeptide (TPR) repeat protein